MKVIIVNGLPRSGKDTFIRAAMTYSRSEEFRNKHKLSKAKLVIAISSIDIIKKIATQMGWNPSSKTAKDRAFLSDLKLLSSSFNNLPFKNVTEEIQLFKPDIAFVQCREADEITKFVEFYKKQNVDIRVILIESTKSITYDNFGDSDVYKYENYTEILYNYSTLEFWENEARKFMDNLCRKRSKFSVWLDNFYNWLCSEATLGDLD